LNFLYTAADALVGKHVSAEQLDRLFDVRHALRHVDVIIDRALADDLR